MTRTQREHPEAAAEPDAILILAYAHQRREPRYWLRRLDG
jgi:hypothetical protein